MVLMAGGACLRMFDIPSDGWSTLYDEDDINNVLESLFPNLEDDKKQEIEDRLCSKIETIFCENPEIRKAVVALVCALLKYRTMRGKEVHTILDPILTDAR